MDFLLLIIQITLFLATFAIATYYKRIKTYTQKTSQTQAPEPPGAWPVIGHLHLLSGQVPVARTLATMADKNGPIFSLQLGSHRALVVSNWEAIKECFTINDKFLASRPNMTLGKYMGYKNAVFALAPYGSYWRELRKMVTVELFTTHRLDKLRHVWSSEIDSFIKHLHSTNEKSFIGDLPKKTTTISTMFEHLTFNISIKILAGKMLPYNGSGADKDRQFKEAIKTALYLSGVFVLSDAIPSLEWLDVGGFVKSMKQTAREIDRVLEDWIRERINKGKGSTGADEEGDQSGDFMDVMLSSIPENEIIYGYERKDVIKATMLILILTGSESTAETLIWALSLLLNNRHALKMAQDELDANVGPHRWVQESDIKNLNYLQAIVKETLRLYPPGPLAGPREAIEDCQVGGFHVSKGTRLIVNLWKLHRDPNVWSDPDEFRPERFIDEHVNLNFGGQCFEYIPFSSGRRMCPGMGLGTRIVQLTLARLLQGFDVSMPIGAKTVDMGEGLGIALPKLEPLEVVLTPRLPPELYENL